MNDMVTRIQKPLLAAFALAALAAPAIAGGHAAPAAEAGPAVKAVSLGQYLITDLRAVEGAKLRVSFELYVDADEEHLPHLREMVSAYKHRIRSEVIVATRMCEQTEFEQPNLERMRRRVLARLKRAWPELELEKLYVGAFQYFAE